MTDILRNSIFLKLILIFTEKASLYCKNSIIGSFFGFVKTAYRYSRTKKALRRYLRRNAYFQYSVTYRIINVISFILSLFCRRMHKIFVFLLKNSVIFGRIKSAHSAGGGLIFIYTGFFTAASVFIYLLFCVGFLTIESINVPVSAGLMVFAFVCLFAGNFFGYIKNSIVYGIVMYFFEE